MPHLKCPQHGYYINATGCPRCATLPRARTFRVVVAVSVFGRADSPQSDLLADIATAIGPDPDVEVPLLPGAGTYTALIEEIEETT